jgi:hypothetical protein
MTDAVESKLKEAAETFRMRLEYGLCTKADVIAWADAEIERVEYPSPELTDVSLAVAGGPQNVLGILRSFPGKIDVTAIRRRFLGELADNLRRDPTRSEGIAGTLCRMAQCGDEPDADSERPMMSFESEFDVAKYTGANEREIGERLLRFLDLTSGSHEELIAMFSDPALRVLATHEIAARGAPALDAIRGVLDGSALNPFGHPYRGQGEVYRCALISARLMGPRAQGLEPLLRDAAGDSTGINAVEAIQALREVEWKDEQTLLVLAEALDREAEVAAEAAAAIERASKHHHPIVARRLQASPRARKWMERR